MAEAAVAAIRAGHNQYPPGPGLPALRQAVAEHQRRFYGLEHDPDTEVVVTMGATEAIAAAVLGLCEPGDEVVTLEPYYDSYAATIAMAGAQRRVVTLRAPDFALDPDALAAAVTPEDPADPAELPPQPDRPGALGRRARAAVARICVERDILAVTDEVYEHLVYDGAATSRWPPCRAWPSAPSRSPATARRSPSPAGRSAGPAARPTSSPPSAPPSSTCRTPGRRRSSTPPSSPSACPPPYYEELAAGLAERRDLLCQRPAGRRPGRRSRRRAPTSSPPTSRSVGATDGVEFCLGLPERVGVVAVPMSVFYDDADAGRTLVRFAFCKRPEILAEAAARLKGLRPT